MEKSALMPVFVYGTLRNGHPNYNRILRGRTISEVPATVKGVMYPVAGGGFPAVLEGEGTVVGEIMYIDPSNYKSVLENLDRLEGFRPNASPRDCMYLRKTATATTADGESIEVYMYIWNSTCTGKPVKGGDWNKHRKKGGAW